MSIETYFTLPIEIDRITQTGPADRYGNPTDEVVTIETMGTVEQIQRVQTGAEGGILQDRERLFVAAGVPLDGWDAIRVNGTAYDVEGPPWHVYNPRTAVIHHVEADVERSE